MRGGHADWAAAKPMCEICASAYTPRLRLVYCRQATRRTRSETMSETTADASAEPAAEPSACLHPEAVGTRWGDPLSEERQVKLQGYLERWAAETNHGGRKGLFHNAQLTGADVFW